MHNKSKKSSAVKRHIVAMIVLPLIIAYLYYLRPLPYFLAFLIFVGVIAMWEFCAMYRVPARLYIPGVMSGGVMLYLVCLYPAFLLNGIFIIFFLLFLLRLFSGMTPSGSMSEIGPVGIGFFYIAGFLSFQWLLRLEAMGKEYIFLLYTSVWMADAGAFYIGTYLGKNKLYPLISPNKTWEGAFGSVLGGISGAVIIKFIFDISSFSFASAAALGVIMGIAALLGDLIESMFKRDAGVKDSSVLIPGHGGVLDKLDGPLVAGPILYFIARIL